MQIMRKVEYVALRLNMTKQRVYELVRQDFFPPGVVVRFVRQIRFNEERLIEFLENGSATAAQGRTKTGGAK